MLPLKEASLEYKKMMAALYGGVIGDLLGVPVEFKKRGTFQVDGVTGYGTYNQPPGTWSDDTSLTLCLIENLIENGNMADLMTKFALYSEQGYWTPFGEMFDIGIATKDAILRFREGLSPEECGGQREYDNGNGALMRIAPIAFVLFHHPDFRERAAIIRNYTEVTHAHPRSIVGSIIYVELLLQLIDHISLEEALNKIKQLFIENYDEGHEYREELKEYSRLFDREFFHLPEGEIRSDGYVVHSLEAAIWTLGHSHSFQEAVLKAVNLGDDTDTVGSITGTLAGIYYRDIPSGWMDAIARKQDIDVLLNRFFEFCAAKALKEGDL